MGAGAAFELGAEIVQALLVFAEDSQRVATFELVAQVVEALLAFTENAHGLAAFEILAGVFDFFAAPLDALVNEAAQTGLKFGEGLAAGDGGFGDLFGGSAGSGGAKVGGEIADGEIDFVANSADDREF